LARSVRLNIIANYIGSGWSALMGFVFVPVYISYLGIEAYGLIGLFATLQAWLSLLDLGLSPTLNREMARLRGGAHTPESIRDLLRSVETIYAIAAVFIALAVFLSSGWLASHWLHAERLPLDAVASALAITGLVIAFRWIGGLYRSALGGLQEQVWLNASNVVFSTFRGAGVIAVLAFVSDSINAFFVFQGILAALEAIVLGTMLHLALPPSEQRGRFSPSALRQIARFAGGVAGITFLALVLTQVDKVVLSGILPLAEFGHYALAGAVASALYMFVNPIAAAVGPKLAELVASDSQRELASAYHRYAQLMSISAIAPAIVVAAFSGDLLLLWTRDPNIAAPTAPIVTVLILGTMMNALMTIPYSLQIAAGWTRFAFKTNVVAVAILLPSLLIIAPRFGAVGAACIWFALNLGYLLVAVPLQHRRLLIGELRTWTILDTGAPLLAVAGTVGIVRGVYSMLDDDVSFVGRALAIVVAAGAAVAAGALSTSTGRALIVTAYNRLLTIANSISSRLRFRA
jgi:O-antigen/teichoic acid export membrane protein